MKSRAYISTSSRFMTPNLNYIFSNSSIFLNPKKNLKMNYDKMCFVIILFLSNLSRQMLYPKPQTKIEQSRYLELIRVIILLSSFLIIPKPQKEKLAGCARDTHIHLRKGPKKPKPTGFEAIAAQISPISA